MCRTRCEGPRTLSITTDANLDCARVENALGFLALKIPGPLDSVLKDIQMIKGDRKCSMSQAMESRKLNKKPFKSGLLGSC